MVDTLVTGAARRGERMTADLARKVAFLRSVGALDHVVETVETHMSWVFLTADAAYKLKKPIRLPFLDFSTVELRRQSCEQELRLGRRLAPDVYRAVVALVETSSGLAIARAGEPAPSTVVDWLVAMRRLPTERMLPQMLARGMASGAHADAVAELLAAFYRRTSRAPWDAAEYRRRTRTLVTTVGAELAARGAPRAQLEPIVGRLLAAIERAAPLLAARIAGGRVVDAHGDLRPEHVFLESPPVIIDPLEFDDQLRMLDVASELAFFTLECERLGARWFADRVTARHAEQTGDDPAPELVAIYRTQHALTRAAIALRRLDDAPPADHERWRAKALDYLARIATSGALVNGSPSSVVIERS
ncbi:MAG TPA: hypothetical protein VFQ53_14755 [Kofleriaceae bacterium]|nr:hypothetical protein [Kofleriaceae bacterium]